MRAIRRPASRPPWRRARLSRTGCGDQAGVELDHLEVAAPGAGVADEILELGEALTQFAVVDPQAAELVQLRYFAGFTIKQAAEALGVSPRTADLIWAYSKAWLLEKLQGDGDPPANS